MPETNPKKVMPSSEDELPELEAGNKESIKSVATLESEKSMTARQKFFVFTVVLALIVGGLFAAGILSQSSAAKDIVSDQSTLPPVIFPFTLEVGKYAQLPASSGSELLLLKRIPIASRRNLQSEGEEDEADDELVVARSYDGTTWESVQGVDPLEPDCNSGVSAAGDYSNCVVNLSSSGGFTYRIDKEDLSDWDVSTKAQLVRLMLQGTFGPTRAEINAYISTHGQDSFDADTWIQEQMALPQTSMRQRWRERSARRATVGVGITSLCEIGSRWHRYAFTLRDRYKIIVIYADQTPGKYSLYIDSILRTEVDTWLGVTWTQAIADDTLYQDGSKIWSICQVTEDVGGTLGVWAGNTCAVKVWNYPNRHLFIASNPAISFTTVDTTMTNVYTSAEITLANVQTKLNSDAVAVVGMTGACDINKQDGQNAYMSVDSVFYRFDPRVKRMENTVEAPHVPDVSVSIYSRDNQAMCPSATRNFINTAGCKRGSSCAPMVFSDQPITLDAATIKKWYSLSSKHVHYWAGLALTQAYEVSPCVSVKARWERIDPGCTVTLLDNATAMELANRIRNSVDASNPHVLDTDTIAPSVNCSESQAIGVSTVGAIIDVDGACFKHVHPNLYDVHDLTMFAQTHPGTRNAFLGNRRNPITRFAEEGRADLVYGHPESMMNFETAFKQSSYLKGNDPIGRLGDVVSFKGLPSSLQTFQMAGLVGSTASPDTSSSAEACGSPNEVANKAELGHQYVVGEFDNTVRSAPYWELDRQVSYGGDKNGVFLTVAVTAPDQLRQRMGFALSQIFNIGEAGFGGFGRRLVSPYAYYHDILNKHAFGNYRELMNEIAFSPFMAEYLTFLRSKSKFSSNSFPDENFARELMQLFSIGLWEMHDNGNYKKQGANAGADRGKLVETYTTVDITNFARAWTGFFPRNQRNTADENESDTLDPMWIDPQYRDDLPKTKLKRTGYIGDAYPICGDLPPQHFLTKGATFIYSGETSADDVESVTHEHRAKIDLLGRFSPAPATSALHSKLCAPASVGAKCEFPSKVTLDENLACDGIECTTTTIFTVQIVDPNDANKVRYYTYQSVPCVRMGLFAGGIVSKHPPHAKQCSDPTQSIAGPVCCKDNISHGSNVQTSDDANRKKMCQFWGEMMNQEQAQARCEEQGFRLCTEVWTNTPAEVSCANDLAIWWRADQICELQVQVNKDGQVSVVDERPNTNRNQDDKRFLKDNSNYFNVLWQDDDGSTTADRYPTIAQNNCQIGNSSGLSCTVNGNGCLCDVTVTTLPVFVKSTTLPAVAEIQASLFIGAPLPSSFPVGTYVECTDAICTEASAAVVEGVKVYLKAMNGSVLVWDMNTIVEYPSPFPGREPVRLFNKASTVFVGKMQSGGLHGGYAFRNPPNFMAFVGEQTSNHLFNNKRLYYRNAELETEAVLDHLFLHNNTPMFVGRKIIQRLVTSNPSARYVKAVADAFRTGTYAGSTRTFSGKRGDLAAMLAAVLLDREARSSTLQADPSHGKMREPLHKVIHLLRSMEFVPNIDTSEIMMPNLQDLIGQGPFASPTVFGFYDVEYSPKGKISKRKLVSPEGELGTGPYIVNWLNGMTSLIDRGLTFCDNGFGDMRAGEPFDYYQRRDQCMFNHRRRSGGAKIDKNKTGMLTFVPSNITTGIFPSAAEVIDEIDLLLTGGRLSPHNKEVIIKRFNETAGLVSKNNTGIPEFNCQCYIDRYPSNTIITQTLETENAAWEPRNNCNQLEAHFRAIGLKQTPPEDGSCSNYPYALKESLKLFMFTQEYHMTNLNRPTKQKKKTKKPKENNKTAYKAIVVIDLIGGADTYNMLVPHSNCIEGKDLYQDYSDARGGVYNEVAETGGAALTKASLHQIAVPTGTQPCNTFGIHNSMPILKELYDNGDLAFLANTGTLIEHLTVNEMRKKVKKKPPSIGDHKGSQKNAQNVDCENSGAVGVMGRLFDELSTQVNPYQADLFSVTGNMKIIEGSNTPYILDKNSAAGVPRYLQYERLKNYITNITSQKSHSIFAETSADAVRSAIDQTEELGSLMGNVAVDADFSGNDLSKQLMQVAKVIKLRSNLTQERGGFVVSSIGWDTHGEFDGKVGPLFGAVNDALDSFQQEMKAQGAWDNVVVVLLSEFGRTITSNGKGTDHGWGGNYFLTGGVVKGGKILGKYPDVLTQTDDSTINIGRGILIPTLPWDAVWTGLAEWMGVPSNKIDTVIPNIGNFPESTLLREAELFD